MYMTGQISPYYLKGSPGNIFSHFLKVSGTAALSGEAICGYHSEGRYYLTKNKEEVAHYRKRADRLLSKASPLMKIYRLEQAQDFQNFRLQNAHTHGERHYILSSLSLYTMTDGLLEQILAHNQLTPDEQAQIIDYVRSSRDFSEELLAHSPVTEEIPLLTEEEFAKYPMTLSLSGYVSGKRCLLYMGRISDSSTSAARIPRKTSSVPRKAKFLACLPQHSDLYSSREICHGI